MNEIIDKARDYATQAHARIDQRRKYSNQAYDVHLKKVAELVEEVTDDPHMLAAAWLHDTVEDTAATMQDIEKLFGTEVADLVADLTDVSLPGDGNRAQRKAIDREHIALASSRAKTVKLADLIDNCRDISHHDPRFAQVFMVEMEALLRVLESGDEVLLKRAHKTLMQCREKLESSTAKNNHIPSQNIDQNLYTNLNNERAMRLFADAFCVQDIAERLGSFDSDTSAVKAKELMLSKDWIVAGLRQGGLVTGYILRDDLQRGCCGDYQREIGHGQLVTGDSSLSNVIHVLTHHDFCFVDILGGGPSGIVLREHAQKPIVRMWLFGVVTIIETNILHRIEELYAGESWTRFLTEQRLNKAREMQSERTRRGQHCRLVDCLQLSDKAQILIADKTQLEWLGFPSKRVAKKVIKDLDSLRNNLAHAQDIITHDWVQIARMTQRIEAAMHGVAAE
ncbi:MAG: bifunctional (p)ppGpp synthetase/guanosine-3',5'-bis(diphosphate) 3'-pyrophosphohydrolase [Gammaproteobacteria bacterium]|nr:MAG: bifunctional (p)ppGpp synthetase/guanosine-3',5'-bis(diphosphate) 3'-pyrophosphohydrolase [Gammaproteobacteria bacterium]RLA54033.1 MAG: bifunctional (p)ppGpp synthetase/guanosine-3',5'-bis(diphosphate) 3'-pyrophosphohydrolase [Gammaproteobacteria bacterium]